MHYYGDVKHGIYQQKNWKHSTMVQLEESSILNGSRCVKKR